MVDSTAAQFSGNGSCHQGGRSLGSIELTHFTHQKPRRPGTTSRAGAPFPDVNGTPSR